jgi:hypothetical protein
MHVRTRIARTLKARIFKVKLLKKCPDLNTIKPLKPLWALYIRYICQAKPDK